jgi:hypothetical protein
MQPKLGPQGLANRSSLKSAQYMLNAVVALADAAQAWASMSGQWWLSRGYSLQLWPSLM